MPQQIVEIAVAAAVFILSALGLQEGLGYAGRSSDMPVAVMGLAMALCALWIAQSVRSLIVARKAVPLVASEIRRLSVIIALGLVYVLAIEYAGFFTSTAIFVPLTAAALGLRRPLVIGGATVLFLAVLYGVFGLLLRTPLPPEAVAQWFTAS